MGTTFNADEYMTVLLNRMDNVLVDATHLTIRTNDDYQYEIALDRIDTAPKILQWVIHLTEKTWMTTELMRQFVYVASTTAGIDPNHLPA